MNHSTFEYFESCLDLSGNNLLGVTWALFTRRWKNSQGLRKCLEREKSHKRAVVWMGANAWECQTSLVGFGWLKPFSHDAGKKKTLKAWENVSSMRNLTNVASCEWVPMLESVRRPLRVFLASCEKGFIIKDHFFGKNKEVQDNKSLASLIQPEIFSPMKPCNKYHSILKSYLSFHSDSNLACFVTFFCFKNGYTCPLVTYSCRESSEIEGYQWKWGQPIINTARLRIVSSGGKL